MLRSPSVPKPLPAYTLHKGRGLARVRIDGRDVYLGRYGSEESHAEYQRVIGEWLATGRTPGARARGSAPSLTVTELVVAYWRYRSAGRVASDTLAKIDRPALRRLRRTYGHTLAADFSHAALRALLRHAVVEEGLSRQYANQKLMPVIKRAFRWGVREGLVPAEVWVRLESADPIAYGEFGARDTDPIRPVEADAVERTLVELQPIVADMVRLQLLTGMRPGELCAMTWAQVDVSSTCWTYRPRHHKNAHRGHARVVPIGPRAQAILMRYRGRAPESPIFSPLDAERERLERLRRERRTPLTPSQRQRDQEHADRRDDRPRPPGAAYTTDSYARAIARACERLGLDVWTPNRLRHARATDLRAKYGLDAAGAILGHARLETTQIYAERNEQMARRVALEVG